MKYGEKLRAAAAKKTLIAAHRGMAGGNIPCNTLAAFQNAYRQGADILEADVIRSSDGELFVFHTGMEPFHLFRHIRLNRMTAAQIRQERYVNQDLVPTGYGILPLEELLETFRGKCFFNLDHCWGLMEDVAKTVRRFGMEEEIILKTPAKEACYREVALTAPELMFMPILRTVDDQSPLLWQMNLNYVGAEVLFTEEDQPVASDAFIEQMHRARMLLWANAIIYDETAVLSAGHTDDRAIAGDPQGGWGWLADKKFDIIQTDWPILVRLFLEGRS